MSNITITVKRALGDSVIEFSVNAEETQMSTPEEGLELFWPSVRMILDHFSQRRNCFKFQVTFDGVFQKHINGEEQTFGFKTRSTICLRSANKNELINDIQTKILESYESFQGMGSGWIWRQWRMVKVLVIKYNPVSG